MKFPLTKLVEVEWIDITTTNTGWLAPDAAAAQSQPSTIRTVGYVLEETKIYLKLAMLQAQLEQNEVGVTCTIPKGVVRRMKILKGLS